MSDTPIVNDPPDEVAVVDAGPFFDPVAADNDPVVVDNAADNDGLPDPALDTEPDDNDSDDVAAAKAAKAAAQVATSAENVAAARVLVAAADKAAADWEAYKIEVEWARKVVADADAAAEKAAEEAKVAKAKADDEAKAAEADPVVVVTP